jgi:hypothetical protein
MIQSQEQLVLTRFLEFYVQGNKACNDPFNYTNSAPWRTVKWRILESSFYAKDPFLRNAARCRIYNKSQLSIK